MAKPASKPDWTVGNPDYATVTIEPTPAKKQAGWLPDERPPREFMNWLFNNIHEWIDYFESAVEATAQYDAIVGSAAEASHSDINDLMADGDIANLKNILVIDLSMTTEQTIDQDNMNFTFKPQAAFVKDTDTKALVLDANGVRIMNARFSNFNTGGDIAIEITAGKKNNLIMGTKFNDCDTEINDLGSNNQYIANITEA